MYERNPFAGISSSGSEKNRSFGKVNILIQNNDLEQAFENF